MQSSVLYSRTSLQSTSAHPKLPVLLSSDPLPLGNHEPVLYVCESVSVSQTSSFATFQIPHVSDVIWCLFFLTYFTQYNNHSFHHVAAHGMILFFVAEQYSVVYTYRIFLFIHTSVDGQLNYFHFLAIVRSDAVNIGLYLFEFQLSITTNKASGGDGIPVELFEILKDDAVKVLH